MNHNRGTGSWRLGKDLEEANSQCLIHLVQCICPDSSSLLPQYLYKISGLKSKLKQDLALEHQ